MTTDGPETRFATYGTFPPGRENHHVVAPIGGAWRTGWVEGETRVTTAGRWRGFAGFVPLQGGPRLPVWLLESDALPDHWARLDAFEGPAFARIPVPVHLDEGGTLRASIYALKPEQEPCP